MNLSDNQVLEILRKVVHPATGKDIISMHLVNSLLVSENSVRFSLEFNSKDPLKSSIKKACIKLLQENYGNDLNVEIDIKEPLLQPAEPRKYLKDTRNIIAIA